MTGKKGHASDTTEQEYGGDKYSGGEHRSGDRGEYGQSDTGAAKPSMMDKIKGTRFSFSHCNFGLDRPYRGC
jgi:hypothetical protein